VLIDNTAQPIAYRSSPTRGAITFAFIARAFEAGKGALHGLTPLFGACVSKKNGSLYEASAIADRVKSSFDLAISPLVVDSMVPALVDAGYLEPLAHASELFRCLAPDPDRDEAAVANEIDVLFQQFRDFAKQELVKTGREISEEDLDSALLDSLIRPNILAVTLSTAEKRKQGQLSLKKDPTSSVRSEKEAVAFLCADFIDQHLRGKPELTDALVNASWGALIAEVVMELQRPDAPTDLSGLKVIIDAPVILDALDVGDVSSSRYANDLLKLLSNAGVSPRIFPHSLEEMRAVLGTTLTNIDLGYEISGPINARARKDPSHLAHVRAVFASLDSRVTSLGFVEIQPEEFERDGDLFRFDDDMISDLRVWIAGEHIHEHVERDMRDAMSVGYTTRMRGGAPSTSLSQCGAVFVSKNARLVGKSAAFMAAKKLAAEYAVPVVVTDQQLAGVLWFSAGGASTDQSGRQLTQLKLAANCARAVMPSPDLINSMRKYLTDPEKSAEFEALLKNDRSAVCLVRETLGASSLSTADDAEKVLSSMKSAAIEEERARLQEQFNTAQQQREEIHAAQVEQLEDKIQKQTEHLMGQQATHYSEVTKLRTNLRNLAGSLEGTQREVLQLAKAQGDAVTNIRDGERKIETRTRKRVSIELGVLFLLVVYGISSASLPVGYSALLSTSATAIAFWTVPELLFGRIAQLAGKKAAQSYRKRYVHLLATLGESLESTK